MVVIVLTVLNHRCNTQRTTHRRRAEAGRRAQPLRQAGGAGTAGRVGRAGRAGRGAEWAGLARTQPNRAIQVFCRPCLPDAPPTASRARRAYPASLARPAYPYFTPRPSTRAPIRRTPTSEPQAECSVQVDFQ